MKADKPCEFCVGGEAVHGRLVDFAIDGIVFWAHGGGMNGADGYTFVFERCDTCKKYTHEEACVKVISILRNHKENECS